MGVTGLWKLIDPSGKQVPLESLENKILAVDISIWLHQVIKGFQDAKGAVLPNAHLLGLFHRLCKLLFYKIKPVFVFDGGVPALKHETMRKRQQSKSKYNTEAERLQQLLLESLAREKVVQQALGQDAINILISPIKNKRIKVDKEDDLFKLPPLIDPQTGLKIDEKNLNTSTEEDEDEDRKKHISRLHNVNINSIDLKNDKFKALPADIRHEILVELKETRKQSSWDKLHELPVDSDDFSSFQMKRLLKRRQVQVSLESAEVEMGGKSLSLAELERLLGEEGIVDVCAKSAKQIASNEHSYNFYINDMNEAKKNAEVNASGPSLPKLPKIDEETVNDSEDEELQKAIKLSLEECCDSFTTNENSLNDNSSSSVEIHLRTAQKKAFGKSAKTLARAYMIEYGGLNSEDVASLISDKEDFGENENVSFVHNKSLMSSLKTDDKSNPLSQTSELKSIEDGIHVIEDSDGADSISSGADSELIEVPEMDDEMIDNNYCIEALKMNQSPSADLAKDFRLSDLKRKRTLEIVVNPKVVKNADDLFADVFCKEECGIESKMDHDSKNMELKRKKMNSEDDLDSKNVPSTSKNILENFKSDKQSLVQSKSNLNDILQSLNNDLDQVLKSDISKEILNISTINIDDSNNDPTEEISSHLFPNIRTDDNDHKNNKSKNESINANQDPEIKEKNQEQNDGNLKNILEHLNQHLECALSNGIKSVALDNLSDLTLKTPEKKSNEIIEILDDKDVLVKKTMKQSDIGNYIKGSSSSTKVTPEKCPESPPPKMASPFFRNRTPSSKKKNIKSDEEIVDHSKVAKTLFPTESDAEIVKPISNPIVPVDLAAEAAQALRKIKTTDELTDLAQQLGQEKRDIEMEINKRDRLGVSVTDRMRDDCQRLLKLFGIPYVVAPMEAEAQCAFFDFVNLTDGTITDDSDIWLFGGKTVYKNFFNQQKNVYEFKVDNIEQVFSVDRNKLIQLSLLVGSDYTPGITGIGPVTALEILATFKSTPEAADETTQMMSLLSGLRKFREWWQNSRNTGPNLALKNKLKNIILSEDFPSLRVIEAYLHPEVDTNQEKFSWGYPDAESIREFAKLQMGWTHSKTNDILLPVLKRMDEKKSQQHILDYFQRQRLVCNKETGVSKRVQRAIKKMSGDGDWDEEVKVTKTKKRNVRRKKSKCSQESVNKTGNEQKVSKKRQPKTLDGDDQVKEKVKVTRRGRKSKNERNVIVDEAGPSTSGAIVAAQLSKRIPNIPDPNKPIPQRVKDLEAFEANKQRAIELIKKVNKKN